MTMDTGLFALATVLRFHQMPAEPQQLHHQFAIPGQPFGCMEILRAAKRLGLKARQTTQTFQQLNNASLPAIGINRQGEFFIIARVSHAESGEEQGKVLIMEAGIAQPRSLTEPSKHSSMPRLLIYNSNKLLCKPARTPNICNNELTWTEPTSACRRN